MSCNIRREEMMFAHQTSLGIQGDVVPGSSLSRVCVCALICLLDDGIRAACFSREHYHIIIGRVLFYHTQLFPLLEEEKRKRSEERDELRMATKAR